MSNAKKIAGDKQEAQVAYHLERAFGDDANYRIMNNVNLMVKGFNSQIDHLILYRAGFVVIESKSIHGEVRVNSLGEWERSYKGEWFGIPSPVQQATTQIETLREYIRPQASNLLDKSLGIQGGFGKRQYKTLIAISSSARLDRENIPKNISNNIVKTEFLVDKVKQITKSAQGGIRGAITGIMAGEPLFSLDEMDRIESFLRPLIADKNPISQEVSVSEAETAQQDGNGKIAIVACKKCGEKETLTAHPGRYGYYVKCDKCSTNTSIRIACPTCGATSTKARKEGPNLLLDCNSCAAKTKLQVEWGGKANNKSQPAAK